MIGEKKINWYITSKKKSKWRHQIYTKGSNKLQIVNSPQTLFLGKWNRLKSHCKTHFKDDLGTVFSPRPCQFYMPKPSSVSRVPWDPNPSSQLRLRERSFIYGQEALFFFFFFFFSNLLSVCFFGTNWRIKSCLLF